MSVGLAIGAGVLGFYLGLDRKHAKGFGRARPDPDRLWGPSILERCLTLILLSDGS